MDLISVKLAENVIFIELGNNFNAIESGTLVIRIGTFNVFSENLSITTLRLTRDSENSSCDESGLNNSNSFSKDSVTFTERNWI